MAANEAGAIQSLRTYGSAQTAFSAVNNQSYATLAQLTNVASGGYLDNRWTGNMRFNGYTYTENQAIPGAPAAATSNVPGGFGCKATPTTPDSTGRYDYGIASDQVVRFVGVPGAALPPRCGAAACNAGDAIGKQ
jgi:hypothetical protein